VMWFAIIGPDGDIIKGTDIQGIFELMCSDHSCLVKGQRKVVCCGLICLLVATFRGLLEHERAKVPYQSVQLICSGRFD